MEVLPDVLDRLSGRRCAGGVDQEVACGGRRGVGPRRAVDVAQDPEINQVIYASGRLLFVEPRKPRLGSLPTCQQKLLSG